MQRTDPDTSPLGFMLNADLLAQVLHLFRINGYLFEYLDEASFTDLCRVLDKLPRHIITREETDEFWDNLIE